jgi:N-acetylneuraminate synthase
MLKTVTIAEIGINFAYGDDITKFVDNAKQLIDSAALAGFDYVKFQKRNPDMCVPDNQKEIPKRVPWREEETTYLQYKKDIELDYDQYFELTKYAQSKGMDLFLSVWDIDSVDFAANLWYKSHDDFIGHPIMKIPSALITDTKLLLRARDKSSILMLSTGMSTEEEIERAIELGRPDIIFHTNSSYPSKCDELNLSYIQYLIYKYPNIKVGYSGHEYGITTTYAAVVLGAQFIERHITLDRTLYGSDQLASVEPIGQIKLIKGIRDIEKSLGKFGPREIFPSELEKRKSLRGEE